MFIGEYEVGIVTKLKSRDVTFLEDDFPRIGEIDRDLHLYEMIDLNIISIPKQRLILELSGNELVPIASIVKEPMLRKTIMIKLLKG